MAAMRLGGRPTVVRGSLRRQAIQMVSWLCVLVLICGGLIVTAVAGNLAAGRNLEQLNRAQLLARDVAADQAADSDALRALALYPNRSVYLASFTRRQIQVETDIAGLNAMSLPRDLVAPRTALATASDAWVIWAADQATAIQSGLALADGDGRFTRQAVVDAAHEFGYHASVLAGQAQHFADLTSALVIGSTVGGVLVGLGGLCLLAWQFFRWNLRPMERLAQAAGDLAAGRTAEITPVDGTTELLALARALEQWRQSMESRVAVAAATLRMSGQVELRQLLQVGGARLAEALDAAVVSFNLRNGDGSLTPHLYVAATDTLTVVTAAPPGAPSEQASTLGTTVRTDLRDDDHHPDIRRYATENHLGPEISVPMVSGGRHVGTLSFVRQDDRAPFSDADVQLAEFSVAHVAAAIHVVELLADLTEANAGLAEANQHKSEFLAHMSHELRTPLNSILGFAQLLTDDSFGPLSERQARYVGHIRSSGDHLLALINDVLDLSKVEAGQLDLQVETFALQPLLDECVGDVRPLADAKDLDLRLRAGGELTVRADRRRLAQVVLNLLSNAIKFTPEGGRVTVSASDEHGAVAIQVRDSGIGIATAEQQRIFDAFFQVRGGRTRPEEGTGLGLALSRRLMELMDGTLNVTSREGRGSTFSVRVPAGSAAAQRDADPELAASGS